MTHLLAKIASDETGATAVEYGLILALIFLAMLGGVQTLGQQALNMWNNTSTTVNAASSA